MGTRVTKMIFKALVVLVVTAVVSCQDPELPIWWQAEPDAGQIPSDAWCGFTKACYDSAECDIQKYKSIKFNKSPTSSIIIPESASDDICIIFPTNQTRWCPGRERSSSVTMDAAHGNPQLS